MLRAGEAIAALGSVLPPPSGDVSSLVVPLPVEEVFLYFSCQGSFYSLSLYQILSLGANPTTSIFSTLIFFHLSRVREREKESNIERGEEEKKNGVEEIIKVSVRNLVFL